MNDRFRRLFLFVGVTGLAAFLSAGSFVAGGIAAGTMGQRATATVPIEGFGLFWEAWEIVERDFVGDIPPEEVVARGAARGLLRALNDPATGLIGPEFARLEREDASGVYKGIGASVRPGEGGYVEIAVVFDGSPAAEAGLRPGDIVLAVDGDDVKGVSLYEVVARIRGPVGTMVGLRIRRPSAGDVFNVEVARREIEIPTASMTVLPGDIAHIRLTEFNSRAASQLREALQEARASGCRALILDLRGNPGGFLDQAVAVADEFLDAGAVLVERGLEEPERAHRSEDGGLATDLPLVVLVNEGSASASEIVAGAIQARGRGILVGAATYGKGSVQYSFTLSDESEIRITTALWYTPDDHLIQGDGLHPDLEVASESNDQEDAQLQAAVDYLLEILS